MKRTAQAFFAIAITFAFSLVFAEATLAQQDLEFIKSGRVTPEQVQEGLKAVEKGQVSPDVIKRLQEEGKLGTLSPAEIEAGKKLLEEKEKEAQEKAPEPAEKKPEVEKKIEAGKEEPFKPDEEFFKKTFGPKSPPLEIFGHKLFSGAPSTFAPIQAVPVSNDYIIGPGDEIKILMWGRLDATYSLVVDNEGIISFPKIGPLNVAGLTFGELKELIKQKAEAITGVNVNVSMGKLRTIQVFVLGEVKSPGVYTVSSLATVANALLSSGGPTSLGSLRRVELKRQGKLFVAIDLYDFLLRGDTSADTRLMPGDVIFVPQTGPMVSVSGNVKRPAIYELRDRRSLESALGLAAGLRPRAYNQRIQIERAFQNQVQIVLDISYEELRQKKAIPLQDGDLIRVFSILPSSVNAVYLYGNVLRPGEYAYKTGLRVLDIMPNLESLDVDTYYDYALIKRYRFENARAELIPFDLGRLLVSRDATQNMLLMPLDEVYVFNKAMFEDREYASVEGQVRKPGHYFIDDMRIKDLILKAGDLTDDVYLRKGELIRIDKERNIHTVYFDVAAAMDGDPNHNLRVQDEDRVIIHSIWEQQWKELVDIKGEVKNPGEYILTRGMRLKDLFFKAGSFTRDAHIELGHLYRTDWRTKEVTIQTFNVQKALEGDSQHNLLLQDLDSVVIHGVWEYVEKYNVSIQGMVHKPGEYPYATNMTVKDLIMVAGNVKDAAYLDQAELVRFDIVDGKEVKTSVLNFDVRKALAKDPVHDLKLKPLDAVHIKEISEWWEKKKTINISGEVLFPGTYQMRKGEHLSDLIERAGGYTERAYLRGAFFTRESVREIQQARLNEMMKTLEVEVAAFSSQEAQATLSRDDIARQAQFVSAQRALVAKLRETKASGRVVVSVSPVSELKGTTNDLALEGGDTLSIPPRPNTVNVLGSVYNPTSLIFDGERPEVKYYLNRTGGPTENAEKGEMYIIRADGTVISKGAKSRFGFSWSSEENRWEFGNNILSARLYPGDTVLVPQKVVRPSFMRDVKDITQILYQIAVIAGITISQVF
jgi:polysaccharide export outer membrane protein